MHKELPDPLAGTSTCGAATGDSVSAATFFCSRPIAGCPGFPVGFRFGPAAFFAFAVPSSKSLSLQDSALVWHTIASAHTPLSGGAVPPSRFTECWQAHPSSSEPGSSSSSSDRTTSCFFCVAFLAGGFCGAVFFLVSVDTSPKSPSLQRTDTIGQPLPWPASAPTHTGSLLEDSPALFHVAERNRAASPVVLHFGLLLRVRENHRLLFLGSLPGWRLCSGCRLSCSWRLGRICDLR